MDVLCDRQMKKEDLASSYFEAQEMFGVVLVACGLMWYFILVTGLFCSAISDAGSFVSMAKTFWNLAIEGIISLSFWAHPRTAVNSIKWGWLFIINYNLLGLLSLTTIVSAILYNVFGRLTRNSYRY